MCALHNADVIMMPETEWLKRKRITIQELFPLKLSNRNVIFTVKIQNLGGCYRMSKCAELAIFLLYSDINI